MICVVLGTIIDDGLTDAIKVKLHWDGSKPDSKNNYREAPLDPDGQCRFMYQAV